MSLSPVLDVAYVGKIYGSIYSNNHNPIVSVRFWILLHVSVHSGSWKTAQNSCQTYVMERNQEDDLIPFQEEH